MNLGTSVCNINFKSHFLLPVDTHYFNHTFLFHSLLWVDPIIPNNASEDEDSGWDMSMKNTLEYRS